jgi:hypothetical protein
MPFSEATVTKGYLMRRVSALVGAGLLFFAGAGAVSTATPQRLGEDPLCAAVRAEYKVSAALPSLPHWVWTIPHGCVFVRDRAPTPECQRTDVRDGCVSPPDIHVRYRGRSYAFHLTLKGAPEKAIGIWKAGGARRFFVTHDGLPPKSRERLFIEFDAREFDGILQSGPSRGLPDLGPELRWRIEYNIDKKSGLCCPHTDPGDPDQKPPFEVTPQRLVTVTG